MKANRMYFEFWVFAITAAALCGCCIIFSFYCDHLLNKQSGRCHQGTQFHVICK